MMRCLALVFVLLLPVAAFGATATLDAVSPSSEGVELSYTIYDGLLGTWRAASFFTNAQLMQYSTWTGFRDNLLVPAVQAEIAKKQAISNRTSFLESRIGQVLTLP
jgi:hypothetical protein